jgi:cold shock CspA family protein
MPSTNAERGRVKFVHERGFLFIVPDRGGKDLYAHLSSFESAGMKRPEGGIATNTTLKKRRKVCKP